MGFKTPLCALVTATTLWVSASSYGADHGKGADGLGSAPNPASLAKLGCRITVFNVDTNPNAGYLLGSGLMKKSAQLPGTESVCSASLVANDDGGFGLVTSKRCFAQPTSIKIACADGKTLSVQRKDFNVRMPGGAHADRDIVEVQLRAADLKKLKPDTLLAPAKPGEVRALLEGDKCYAIASSASISALDANGQPKKPRVIRVFPIIIKEMPMVFKVHVTKGDPSSDLASSKLNTVSDTGSPIVCYDKNDHPFVVGTFGGSTSDVDNLMLRKLYKAQGTRTKDADQVAHLIQASAYANLSDPDAIIMKEHTAEWVAKPRR
jgi:hypothetical protein